MTKKKKCSLLQIMWSPADLCVYGTRNHWEKRTNRFLVHFMTDETIEMFYLWYDFWVLDFSLHYAQYNVHYGEVAAV